MAWVVDRRSGGPIGDEPDLLGYAGRLLDGHYANAAPTTSYLWHGPGLPAALAPLLAVHAPLWLGRLLLGPAVMFAAVVGLAAVLRASLPGSRPRVVAAAFGLYLPFLSVLSSLHKEPLAAALVVAAMGAAVPALREGARPAVAAAGVALAALAMTRVEYGWVLVVLAGVAVIAAVVSRAAAARRALAACGVALVLCTPWLVYTHHVSGRLAYWGNAGGLSLYWMSSPDQRQLGEWHAVHTVRRDAALAAYRPLFRALQRLPAPVEDARLRALAVRQAVAHPAKYALNLVANAGRMALAWPFGVRMPWWGMAGVALSNLVLVGALLRRRRPGGWRALLARRPEAAAFGAFAAVALAVHLLPSSEPRMAIPLVPVLVWLAAARHERVDDVPATSSNPVVPPNAHGRPRACSGAPERFLIGRSIPRRPRYSDPVRPDLVRGHLDGLLLAVLADAPGHGYELIQRLSLRSGSVLDLPEGTIYPALHRLERAGLVTSGWSTHDGRRRRVYQLSVAGRRAAGQARKEWRAFAQAVDGVLGAMS